MFFVFSALFPIPSSSGDETDLLSVSPTVSILEQPRGAHPINEFILNWPKNSIQNFRLEAPEVQLDNLDLIGVSQESTSKSNTQETHNEASQTLTFQFRARKTGAARVNRLELRWTSNNGAVSSQLMVPPIDIEIVSSTKSKYQLLAIGVTLFSLIIIVSGVLTYQAMQKTKRIKTESHQTVEALILKQFHDVFDIFQQNDDKSKLVEALHELFHQYLAEKLDWHPKQTGYNELLKKAEEQWSKKDARELEELMNEFDIQRFSGVACSREDLLKFYRQVSAFVERRSYSINPEASWKPASNK